MKLALIAVLLVACGSSARETTTVAHHAPDDRRIVQRFEIRGVLDGRAAELRALVRDQIAPGVELTEERYAAAHEAIENDYYERGHIQLRLDWHYTSIKGPFAFVLTIREGPRFKIKSLDVADVADADRARYLALATIKPGDYFARSKLRAWYQAIRDTGANVEVATVVDLVAETIALTLHVSR